jgi:predicted dehydrogenase
MMKTYSVALIGATLRGAYLLAPAMADTVARYGLQVCAVYDPDLAKASEAALLLESRYEQAGISADVQPTDDLRGLLTDQVFDLLVVSVPVEQHLPLVKEINRVSDRLVLEAPIALNVKDAQAIEAATEDHPLFMNFARHFDSGWYKVFELLQAGMIGELQFINLAAYLPATNYLRLWQRSQEHADELFLGLLCQYMDVCNWFAGDECVSIAGVGDVGHHDLDDYDPTGAFKALFNRLPIAWRSLVSEAAEGEEVNDFPGDDFLNHGALTLTYANEVTATVLFTSHGPSAVDEEDLELVGSKGRIWFNARRGVLYVHAFDGSEPERIDGLADLSLPSFEWLDAAFFAQLPLFAEGIPPAVTAVEGVHALTMALAALESINANGTPVMLPLEIGEDEG